MRPASIVNFERVVLLMIVLALVNAALNWEAMTAYVRAQGMGPTVLIVVQAFSVAVMLLLLWLIARRRSVVAKWIWIALVALGIAMAVPGLSETFDLPAATLIVQLVQWLLSLATVWLLLRPDASAWFAGRDEPPATVS